MGGVHILTSRTAAPLHGWLCFSSEGCGLVSSPGELSHPSTHLRAKLWQGLLFGNAHIATGKESIVQAEHSSIKF